MSWAARRRFIIALIIGGAGVAFLTAVSFATFYKSPSCIDNVQNQDEGGIDCDGPCPYLCAARLQPPTVLFTKALTNTAGRTDIIASVENKNAGVAAKNVPYRVALYGADRLLIQEVSGTLDLPPGASVPVFIPGIVSGKQTVAGAFLSIDDSSPRWFRMASDPRIVPTVVTTKPSGTTAMPRFEVTLLNSSVVTLTDVMAIILVRDDKGEVIAASSTVVPAIPAQGQATATFTWNSAFLSAPASIQVVPIIPLP